MVCTSSKSLGFDRLHIAIVSWILFIYENEFLIHDLSPCITYTSQERNILCLNHIYTVYYTARVIYQAYSPSFFPITLYLIEFWSLKSKKNLHCNGKFFKFFKHVVLLIRSVRYKHLFFKLELRNFKQKVYITLKYKINLKNLEVWYLAIYIYLKIPKIMFWTAGLLKKKRD